MTRLRIYMDVDGVLNASVPHPGWFPVGGSQPSTGLAQGYRIQWAQPMVDALNKFVLEHDAEFVWATTWCHAAQEDIAPLLGLDVGTVKQSRVLLPINGRVSFPSIDWKVDALINEQRESPMPFVWLEDEISNVELRMVENAGIQDMLAINPGFSFGIQPKHLEAMEAFSRSLDEEEE